MSKLIPLTKGKWVIVDNEDFEFLNQWRWFTLKHKHTFYACRNTKDNQKIYMHRILINATEGENVDHRNHNGLDNRKKNLRLCEQTFNLGNARKRKVATSQYKGVCWDKNKLRWHARIQFKGKVKSLGYYLDERVAAEAYNKAAIETFGEFAHINKFANTLKAIV